MFRFLNRPGSRTIQSEAKTCTILRILRERDPLSLQRFPKTESSNKELPVMRIDACLAILMHIHLQAFQCQAQLSKVQQGPPVQVRRDTAVVIMAVPADRELRHGEGGSRRAESLVGSLRLRVAQL